MSASPRILKLKPKRERSVLNFHPWVFSGAVEAVPDYPEGAWVQVCTSQNEILGYGHFSPHSQIVCRILTWETQSEVSEWELIRTHIENAIAWRKKCFDKNTTGYRLIHAEGDFLPGLIVDQYAHVLVMQLRTAGMLRLQNQILECLVKNTGVSHVLLRGEKPEGGNDCTFLLGDTLSTVSFLENGLPFHAEVLTGQKTGFFLDQRENRKLLQHYAQGKNVLNTFAYSGAFSVYALAGKAKEVISVDLSGKAIDACIANVSNAMGKEAPHTAIVADCFDFLKDMPADLYDLIILDPPAFTKHISTVDKAARGYKEINMKAIRKIRKGGILFTFSCSQHISSDLFRKIIYGAAADVGRKVQVLHRLAQPEDHPVSIYHPEGEYLKGLVLRVGD